MADNHLSARLHLFPLTTQINSAMAASRLTVAGFDLVDLASEFGTPLYIYDQATIEDRLSQYRKALTAYYPATSGLTYAGKAYLCLAVADWMAQNKVSLDCTGSGEIAIAVAAGVEREQVIVHGVNKSIPDLEAAASYATTIIADNRTELTRLINLRASGVKPFPELWLRLRPGVAVDTHVHRQTGQVDSKFGFSPSEMLQAVEFCLSHNLPLTGVHFHLGSHFHNPEPVKSAIQVTIELLDQAKAKFGWFPQSVSPGGGWGVPYHEDDLPHPSIEDYVKFLSAQLINACQERSLSLPHLQVEPGRSLIAQAGIALYQVGEVKFTDNRRWLLMDGGMADNPRPALYSARYTALPVIEPLRDPVGQAWLAGPYCESGDILINNLPMADIAVGEVIAIPVSGAYQLSMGSNYNGARKPAVLWLGPGRAQLIQKRETLEDLYRRDVLLT